MNQKNGSRDNSHPPQQACPIGDYALISDCRAAALLSRRGSIDWCRMPRFDSEPCFGRLLDWRRAGYLSIAPAEGRFDCARRYLEDTMVLCTRFDTETGSAQVFDPQVLTDTDTTRSDRTHVLFLLTSLWPRNHTESTLIFFRVLRLIPWLFITLGA